MMSNIEAARAKIFAELGVPIEHFNCKCAPTRISLTIKRIIFNDPATVIYWNDDTRTVVKCQPGDKFDPELGFLLAVLKKACGNTGAYNDLLRKFVPGYGGEKKRTKPDVKLMREELAKFCKGRGCYDCPMGRSDFECGRGKFFTTPAGEPGYMTNESIVKHYRTMEGAKSQAKEAPENGHE